MTLSDFHFKSFCQRLCKNINFYGILKNAIKVVNKYNRYLIKGDSNSIKKNTPNLNNNPMLLKGVRALSPFPLTFVRNFNKIIVADKVLDSLSIYNYRINNQHFIYPLF